MGDSRNKSTGLSFADLFCGAGGLSAGFRAAGYEPVFALDKDRDSCATYERNFGLAPEHASITDFEPADLAGKLDDVDVILGGPSCQTFSTQGRRFTWADPKDERTKLWRHMLALVDEVRPRAFLLENVPGLSHKGLAYEKDGRAQGEIVSHFEELGYALRAKILLAADYGVPQLRRRLFVVGVQEDMAFEFPSPTHLGGWRRDTLDIWEEKRIELGLLRHLTLGEAVGDLPPLRTGNVSADQYARDAQSGYEKLMRVGWKGSLRDHEVGHLGEKHLALVQHVPPGGTWRDIPPHLLPERFQGGMRRTDSTNLLGRLDPDRPSYTITTQFNNVTAGCFTHPHEDRALSVREGARLQSFPDSFEFTGTLSSRCRQIGNAVPPLLAQHLACALVGALDPDAQPRRPKRVTSIHTPATPVPDETSRARMVRQPRQRTKPENRLFDALEERGIVFERNQKPVENLRREVDGCLAVEKVAVFVDGCFWHGCPVHSRPTKSNTQWWREKIDRNKARDLDTDATLLALGWLVVRVWEHEDPVEAATRVEKAVANRTRRPRRTA
ncbi:MAG: DNA (cytosine-5-)-methyltransferase [Deltaproteobacteria bacterium]